MGELKKIGFQFFDMRKAVFAAWNYKEDHEEQMKKLIRSILNEGFIINSLLRKNEDGDIEVVDGNHRKAAIEKILDVVSNEDSFSSDSEEYTWCQLYKSKNLDLTKIMCYYLGEISMIRAKELSLKANGSWFDDNYSKKREIVIELHDTYGDAFFESTPLNMDDFIAPEFEPSYGKNTLDDFDGIYVGKNENSLVQIKFNVPKHLFDKWEEVQATIQIHNELKSPSDFLEYLIDFYNGQSNIE